jgi:N-acetylmuramoyl-L-alanine amidase
MIRRPSPNFDRRTLAVDMIVLHYTGMRTAAAALRRLCDPKAKVSAHYLIDEKGRTFVLVPEENRAWHAGQSSWHGVTDINSCSIGIELANPGHDFGYRAFPEPQMRSLEALAAEVVNRHDISPARVLGHSDVAPERKSDPGELFDWRRLARRGIGLWPEASSAAPPPAGIDEGDRDQVAFLQAQLQTAGYGIAVDGHFGPQTRAVVLAFQRHFRPQRVDGRADGETLAALDGWLRLFLDD